MPYFVVLLRTFRIYLEGEAPSLNDALHAFPPCSERYLSQCFPAACSTCLPHGTHIRTFTADYQ